MGALGDNVIAIMPARAGSKRIPRKNIKDFCGRPMLSYALRAAVESGAFDRVIMSTDSDEIAASAQAYGAEAPFRRPAALSDDHATTVDVVVHTLEWLTARGEAPSALCCIYPTAVFLTAASLAAGRAAFATGHWDYVFSATRYPFPIQRAFQICDDGAIKMFDPDNFFTRSQDLTEAYHDAGMFYWGKPAAWAARKPVFSGMSRPIILPRWEVQDIDTEEDWEYAEKLWRLSQISDDR